METTLTHSNPPPDKTFVIVQLQALINGSLSREAVALWANQWVTLPDPPDMNDKIWDMLVTLSGADLEVEPDIYLHGLEDFHAWLNEVEAINNTEET